MSENRRSSVTNLVAERIRSGSKPHERQDPWKVGLVVEGGGMAGIIPGGMAVGLQALGARDAFDGLYGTSAGGCTVSYFATEQGPEGASIYFTHINNRTFINPARMSHLLHGKGRPPVDIPYLTHKIMQKETPLNASRIVENEIPIFISVTSARDGNARQITDFPTKEVVFDALHWGCRLPLLAGLPVQSLDGDFYTDGGVGNGGIPFQEAVDDGCTHILALLSSPRDKVPEKRSRLKELGARIIRKDFPAVAHKLQTWQDDHNKILQTIFDAEASEPSKSVVNHPAITSVRIEGKKDIAMTEKRSAVLKKGARDGVDAVLELFKPYGLPVNQDILNALGV